MNGVKQWDNEGKRYPHPPNRQGQMHMANVSEPS